jgi:hypothetical protein
MKKIKTVKEWLKAKDFESDINISVGRLSGKGQIQFNILMSKLLKGEWQTISTYGIKPINYVSNTNSKRTNRKNKK